MHCKEPLYSVYSDIHHLSGWKFFIVRTLIKLLKLHNRAEIWGRYFARNVGALVAELAPFAALLGIRQ